MCLVSVFFRFTGFHPPPENMQVGGLAMLNRLIAIMTRITQLLKINEYSNKVFPKPKHLNT